MSTPAQHTRIADLFIGAVVGVALTAAGTAWWMQDRAIVRAAAAPPCEYSPEYVRTEDNGWARFEVAARRQMREARNQINFPICVAQRTDSRTLQAP